MAQAPISQFPIRVSADEDDPHGPAAVEEFGQELRRALEDLDVVRVDPLPSGTAPDGARGLEVLAALGLVITVVQAGEAMVKVVRAIRLAAARYAERRQRLRVTVADVEVDLTRAGDAEVEHVVRRLLALPTQNPTGVRSALIVANARYDDPALTQLRSPGHDADALARVLGDPAIGGFDVELLTDADERTIRRRTAAFFADRDRDDVLLLHFSCHGVKDPRGRLYLAARDTDMAVLGATGIPASFVNDLLAETQSRRVILILDCCYSGAFGRDSAGVRSGSEVHIADEFGAGSGRIVLTASSATEYAFEGGALARDDGQPSAFTSALVNGLETGTADLDADGEISIDELYDFTYRRVRETTPGQAPMKWSFGVEGSLVVARSVRPATLPVEIVDDLASERIPLRLEAVRRLGQLVATGRPAVRTTALGALAEVRDTDDSARVRSAAAQTLAASVPTGPIVTTPPAPPPVRPMPPAQAPPPAREQPVQPPPPVAVAPPVQPAPLVEAVPHVEPPPQVPTAPTVRASATVAPPSGHRGVPAPDAPASAAPHPAPAPAPATPPENRAGPAEGTPTPSRMAQVAWIVAALLALLSAALQFAALSVADSSEYATNIFANADWLVLLVAVTGVLITRRRSWASLMAGLLAWQLVLLGTYWHADFFDDIDGAATFRASSVVGVLALVAAVVGMVAARRDGAHHQTPRPRSSTVILFAAVLPLAIVAGVVADAVIVQSLDLSSYGDGLGGRILLDVLAAAALVATIALAPRGAGIDLTAVGWLVEGVQIALLVLVASEVGAAGFLLVVALAAGLLGIVAGRLHALAYPKAATPAR